MAIKIKQVGYETQVYQNEDLVGTCGQFCCGIDFRPLGKPNALFSILKVRNYSDYNLKRCIKAILSIEIPDRPFHANFNLELAKDKTRLLEYQTKLNTYKEEHGKRRDTKPN